MSLETRSAPEARLHVRGRVAEVVLAHPVRRNALSRPMRHSLVEAFTRLAGDAAVRVVVLSAEGADFCSGMDLEEMRSATAETTMSLATVIDAVRALPQPVIGAIDGHALGGGAHLAVSCDLRIAGATARMGIPAARLGVVYPAEAVDALVAAVGPATATYLLLTARTLDAHECLAAGLVHEVATEARVRALDLADRMSELSPVSVAAAKALIRAATTGGAAGSEVEATWAAHSDRDLQVGLAAIARGGQPAFPGL